LLAQHQRSNGKSTPTAKKIRARTAFAHERALNNGARSSQTGEEMTTAAPVQSTQPAPQADPYALAARIALWLSGLVAGVTMAGALYIQVPSMRRAPTPDPALHERERWSPAIDEPDDEPVRTAKPVRIVNPFDDSEVFEFPEGTSLADARAAMADALTERARERYARLEDQAHKRRVAGP
jgi:hypothetical protein